jgi:hypothetical protein
MKLTNVSILKTCLPIWSLFALLLLRQQRKQKKVAFNASVLVTSVKTQGGLGDGNANTGESSTGVALHYHCHKEFHALNKEQKDELCE